MSIWKFILIDSSGSETEIDNPDGWNDITVNIERDDNWHGIFFSYAFQKMTFFGDGASLIKAEYEEKGVDGDMEMSILFQCSDGETYDEFYRGRLSFDEYEDVCGDECSVTIGLQDLNDIMLMRNNYEQKVNLNSNIAFDETTTLTNYDFLNFDLEVLSRGLPIRSEGGNDEEQGFSLLDYSNWSSISGSGTGTVRGATMPIFVTNALAEIRETTINSGPYFDPTYRFEDGENSIGTPPFIHLLPDSGLKCTPSDFRMQYRVKGRLEDISNATRIVDLNLIVRIGANPAVATVISNQILLSYETGTPETNEFDVSFDEILNILSGDNIYFYINVNYFKSSTAVIQALNIYTEEESFIHFSGISYCEATTAKSCMINEAVSRTVEAITNDQIRFYSTFFGRKNSQPYSIPLNTCAGAFAISNGLNVRRRLLKDGTQPGFFVTLKQLFEETKAIWNTGLTIEPDLNRPGFNRLRFEDWRYFYQDEVGLRFNYPTKIPRKVATDRVFNRMVVGYNKWTAGEYSGLDEFMTKRNYRVNINAVSNELDATTDIICSPYTIEITRRLDTGTDDWQYDNEVFGFCTEVADGTPVIETFETSTYSVENVNDPNTCYNGRISPARNAMRWFNYVMQGLRNLQPDSKLIFTGGEANYIAKYGLSNCNIEANALQENENIEVTDFENENNARPILYPETITFDHPLNFNLFKKIKNDPALKFKSIEVNCNGTMLPAWLKSISYKPEQGQATIVAIPKNNSIIPEPPTPIPCQATIVDGSVTMTDFDWEAGTATVDFTEGNAGATQWSYIITQGSTPGAGTGFNGITTTHPFSVGGLTPGTWSVFIAPYCTPDEVGLNYGAGTFELESPPFKIELSAVLTNLGSNNHLVLTANTVGAVPAPAGFSFQWGQCVYNTSIPTNACRAYPGSVLPLPTNTMTFSAGDTTQSQNSVTITAGSGYGYITKIVIYNLTGISSADIIKAAGQGWTLEFM
jgi:hypothetical protein